MTLLITQCSTDDYHLSQISRKYFSLATSHTTLPLEQFYARRTINSIQLGKFCEIGILLLACQTSKNVHELVHHKYMSALVKLINLLTPQFCRGSLMLAKCTFISMDNHLLDLSLQEQFCPLQEVIWSFVTPIL